MDFQLQKKKDEQVHGIIGERILTIKLETCFAYDRDGSKRICFLSSKTNTVAARCSKVLSH